MKSLYVGITLLLFAASVAWAQGPRDRGDRGDRGERGNLRLKSGDSLPDASGHTENGEPIHLKELKGKHAVIVFGCLT